jgi:hypothetical protein
MIVIEINVLSVNFISGFLLTPYSIRINGMILQREIGIFLEKFGLSPSL